MTDRKHDGVWAEFEGKWYDLTNAWISHFQNVVVCSCCGNKFTGPGYALDISEGQLCQECMTTHMKAAGYTPLAGGVFRFREPVEEPPLTEKEWGLRARLFKLKDETRQGILGLLALGLVLFFLVGGIAQDKPGWLAVGALYGAIYNALRINALERKLP